MRPNIFLSVFLLALFILSSHAFAYNAELFTPPLFGVEANRKLPNKEILKLETDAQGFIWIGTRRGVFRFDGYEYQPLLASDGTDISTLHVRSLLAVGQVLWIGTMTKGVFRVDLNSLKVTQFQHDAERQNSLGGNQVNAIEQDADGKLWFAHINGLDRLDAASDSFSHFESLNKPDDRYFNYLLDLEFDADGRMWLSTAMGLARFDTAQNGFSLYGHSNAMLHKVVLRRIFLASDNRLWLASQNQGTYILDPNTGSVTQVDMDKARDKAINTGIAETREADGRRRIWLSGTKGVEVRDAVTGKLLKLLNGNLLDDHGLAGDIVYSMTHSADGTLWFGVLGVGLQYHPPQAKGFAFFDRFSTELKTLFSSFIHSVVDLGNSRLLVLTEQQAEVLDLENGRLSSFFNDEAVSKKLWVAALGDSQGNFWFGGDSGNIIKANSSGEMLQEWILPLTKNQGVFVKSLALGTQHELWAGSDRGLVKLDLKTQVLSTMRNSDGSRFISFIRCLYLDTQNRLWVGTNGGLGLVEPGSDVVQLFSTGQGTEGSLRNNQIKQITTDSEGRLLVVHPEGIDALVSATMDTMLFTPLAIDITQGMTAEDRVLALPDGRIWLGNSVQFNNEGKLLHQFSQYQGALALGWGKDSVPINDNEFIYVTSNGLLLVEQDAHPRLSAPAQLAITELRLGNTVVPFDSQNLQIQVGADEQGFSVRFAIPGAVDPDQVEYRYRLDGYDDDWLITPVDIRLARYTALAPGDYRLRLQAKAPSEEWGAEKVIKVSIAAKYYQTIEFRLLMCLLFLAAIYGLFRWRLLKSRQAQLSLFEHRDALRKAQMLSELMDQKNRLLAEVSHDLRTPLAMIKVQLEAMQDGLLQSNDATFDSLAGSLGNLNRMVGDLVQLSEHEGSTLAMNKRPLALIPLLNEQLAAFKPLLAPKRIAVAFTCDSDDSPVILADKDRIEQVLGNLLKNSYRYTGPGGQVQLTLSTMADSCEIRIDDSAPGVLEEELDHLFDRLYRGTSCRSMAESASKSEPEPEPESGSGLGLWICHTILQAHGGTICAEPSPLGGVSIRIVLPRIKVPEDELG